VTVRPTLRQDIGVSALAWCLDSEPIYLLLSLRTSTEHYFFPAALDLVTELTISQGEKTNPPTYVLKNFVISFHWSSNYRLCPAVLAIAHHEGCATFFRGLYRDEPVNIRPMPRLLGLP
jgi:hypothetical protein